MSKRDFEQRLPTAPGYIRDIYYNYEHVFAEDLICFENIFYLDLLKKGGEFYRSSKKVRLYNDLSKNRLSFITPSTNFRNMRNGYIRTLKKNWLSLLIHNQIILLANIIKIIIYNRLIKRETFSINKLLSILILPFSRKIILDLKSYYDMRNNLYGLSNKINKN